MCVKSILLGLILGVIIPFSAQSVSLDTLKNILNQSTGEDKINFLLQLSYDYYTKDLDQATLYANQALHLAKEKRFKEKEAKVYKLLGKISKKNRKYEEAKIYYLKASSLYEKLHQELPLYQTYTYIGDILYYQNKSKEAISYFDKSLKIARSTKDRQKEASNLEKIADVYRHEKNDKEALTYYKKALQLNQEIGNVHQIAKIYKDIGSAHKTQKSFDKAMNNFQKSLELYQQFGSKENIASCYNNIARVHDIKKDYKKAIKHYLKTSKIYEEIGHLEGVIRTYGYLADVYEKQKKYKKAIEYTEEYIRIKLKIGNKSKLADSYSTLGYLYKQYGDYAKSTEYYNKSVALSNKLGNKEKAASTYSHIATNYKDKGDLKSAIDYLNKSLVLAEEIGAQEKIKKAYSSLSETYSYLKDFKQAYKYYLLYTQIKDSIERLENMQNLVALQEEHEKQQRKKEIELLKSKNDLQSLKIKNQTVILYGDIIGTILLLMVIYFIYKKRRQKQKDKISRRMAELEQKALKAQMNPHFIFNALNAIQGLIIDNKQELAMKYLSKFSKLLRVVLENSGRKSVDLEKELNTIELYMQLEQMRTEHKFDYKINIDEEINTKEVNVSPMLIQPYVENAIWHGIVPKDKRGEINIDIKRNNGLMFCSITDDGIGRDKARALKPAEHQSKGMHITKERLEVLNNAKNSDDEFIKIVDLYDNNKVAIGTKVEIKFPYSKS